MGEGPEEGRGVAWRGKGRKTARNAGTERASLGPRKERQAQEGLAQHRLP